MKASRLARLVGDDETQEWLSYELSGFYDTPVGRAYMGYTGRWLDETKEGYFGSLAVQVANLKALEIELQALRIPDVSVSSSNPHEYVSGLGLGTKGPEAVVN